MPTIADLRKQIPYLEGLDDDSAVDFIQQTYYPDVDRAVIADRLGVKAAAPEVPTRRRGAFETANDTVIEAANALAGAVKSGSDFIAPGNRVGRFIEDEIIRPGEASQSDVVRAEKARYASEMEQAGGIGGEIGSTLGYVGRNPLLTAAQVAGSFVLPGAAVKGGGMLGSLAGLGAKGAARAGLAGGAVAGGMLSGGDAAGTAYDLVKKAGGSDAEAEEAARRASVIPAAVGAAGGVIGAERLLAGLGGKGGAVANALRTAGIEGAQEAFEEGITQYEGQRAAVPFDPSIDPMKGVAGAATMGGIMGGATGAAVGALQRERTGVDAIAKVLAAGNIDDTIAAAREAISVPAGFDADQAMANLDAQRAEDEKGLRQFGRGTPPPWAGRAPAGAAGPAGATLTEGERIVQFTDRVLNLQEQLADPEVRQKIRAQFGDQGFNEIAYYATTANNTDVDMPYATRERMVGLAEGIIERALFKRETRPGLGGPEGGQPLAIGAEPGAPRIGLDTAPTGGIRVDAAGNAAPETRADAISTRQREAERRAAPDLGKQTPRGMAPEQAIRMPGPIPVGETTELPYIPTGDATELDAIPAGEATELLPTGETAELPKRIPTGQATELPVEVIQADDLMTKDGMPYGSLTAAKLRARRDGGEVVAVQGGWVVRPEPAQQPINVQPNNTRGFNASDLPKGPDVNQRELPAPAGLAVRPDDGGGDQLAGSGGTVGRMADAGGAGQVDAGLPSVAPGGDTDQAAGPGRSRGDGDALTPGQRVTLAGQSWTVEAVDSKGVTLNNGEGTRRMIVRGSKTFGQIRPEAKAYGNDRAASDKAAEALAGNAPDGVTVVGPDGMVGVSRGLTRSRHQVWRGGWVPSVLVSVNGNDLWFDLETTKPQEPNEAARPQAQAAGAEAAAPAAAPAPAAPAVAAGTGRAGVEADGVAQPPMFESYADAQAWVNAQTKKAGGALKFRASDEYKAAYEQIKALYDAEKKGSDQERLADMKAAGLAVGDKVQTFVRSMFLGGDTRTGTIAMRGGAPIVKINGEMAVSGPGGKLRYVQSLPWDARWKKAAPSTSNAEAPVQAAPRGAGAAPVAPAPSDDYLKELFGASAAEVTADPFAVLEREAAKGAETQRADAKRIRDAIGAEKKRAQDEYDDWSSRTYKRNKTQVDLRGDGPSNQGSMSIGAINESRRRNAMEALTQELKALDKLGQAVATDSGAEQFMGAMRALYARAEKSAADGNGLFKTPGEQFQYMLLDDLKFRGPAGKGNVTSNGLSKAVLSAVKPAAAPERTPKAQAVKEAPKPAKAKVYKTRGAADTARKEAGNTTKVQKTADGFILRQKTDKEIAAEARAAQRLRTRPPVDTEKDPLLTAIGKLGGLAMGEKADTIGEGNKLTAGGHVFTRGGHPIDIMAGDLAELNYIPADEMARDGGTTWLRDAIKAEYSGTRQHFSEAGEDWMRDAQAAAEARYDDDPLADFTAAELDEGDFTGASPDVQAATEVLLQAAESLGIDTEAIRERVAMESEGLTEDEYHAKLQAAITAAFPQGRGGAAEPAAGTAQRSGQDRGQAAGDQGAQGGQEGLRRPPVAEGDRIRFTSNDGATIDGMAVQVLDTSGGNYRIKIRTDEPAPQGGGNISRTVYSQDGTFAPLDAPLLTAQTPDELRAKAAAQEAKDKTDRDEQKRLADKAKADAEVGEFTLTGSDRAVDVGAAAGQGGLFDAAPAPAAQASAILDAAADPPKGRERLEVLKDVKAGAVTPEEVAAAYPPSEAQETTDAQRQQAADHAKDLGGRVVWQRGDLALIEGYSMLSGDSVYIAASGSQRTRVDIQSFTGKGYTDAQKAELMKARADAVRAADELLARNPDGPFADEPLVFADDIPAAVQGVARGWIGLLGLDDARIVVTTPTSGAAMADGMAGKFRRIGKASLSGDNTNGTMQPLGGDDFHIAVRSGASTLKALEVLAHELGHVVERRAFAQADAGTQQAIRDAHAGWLKENGSGRALDMAQAMRAYRSGQTTGFSEDAKALEAGAYWRSFGEWFADQVSRWATTQDRPVGVVEQFFKRLADRLRGFFTGERAKFKPNTTVAQWLDSLAKDVPPAEEVAAAYPAAEALNDRDHFTVSRGTSDNKMETVTFARGEYITYRIGEGGKQAFGEIDGISHAKREFSVDGLWHPFGFAYKAERPAPAPKQGTEPLSKTIDRINAKNGAGLGPADAVSPFAAFKAVMQAVYDGTATVEDYQAGYARVRDEAAMKAELGKMTKDELTRTFGIMRDGKKDELVSMAYEGMLRSFALGKTYGPTSYMMVSGGYADYKAKTAKALDELVAGQTADDLAAYAAEEKRASEERASKRAALVESVKNPKTLADFQNFIRYHKEDGKTFAQARMMLTPEQRAAYDELAAESTRGSRKARQDTDRTTVRAAGQTTAGEIIATKHTRDGHDLWVVRLADRVSKDDYGTLLASAKRLGGNYSSFRGNGAVPGFQFRTPEAAQAFLKLAGGDTAAATEVAQERRNAFEDDRSQSAAERLTEMADRLEERADESMGRDRKANTDRRARFAASAEASARADKAMATTMRNIAQAVGQGGAKFLDRVRQKVQVELLQTYVANGNDAHLRAKYPTYAEQERHKGEAPTIEAADYAEFPTFTAYRSDLASLGRQLLEVDGTKKMGERLMKVADDVSDAFTAFAKEPGNLFRLSTFSVRAGDEVRTAIFPTREGAERAITRSGLSGKAIVFPEKRGVNRIIMSPSEAMARGIWKGDGDTRITLAEDFGNELVEKIGRVARRGAKVSVPWQFERTYDRRKQLGRMGIETPAEFRAALREFIGMREQPAEADKIKAMERAMIGRRNDGLDFFPTPESVADEMVAAADIQPGMRVLEPSAGMGHIAERIRASEVEPDVGEFSAERRELLEAKGFNVVARDFMAMDAPVFGLSKAEFLQNTRVSRVGEALARVVPKGPGILSEMPTQDYPTGLDGVELTDEDIKTRVFEKLQVGKEGGYDRILMNPPFSDGRDIQHVRHAYDLLKPGGRLVAIMGESAFTSQNKRAAEFREWLGSVGGTDEKLPEGSFNDPSLPVNTGANARMVVVEKPATGAGGGAATAFSRAPGVRAALDKAIAAKEAFGTYDRKAVKVGDPETFFTLAQKMADAEEALAAELMKQPDDGFALQGRTGLGRLVIVNRSAQNPGQWQLTRFDANDEPWGDSQYRTKESVLTDFLREVELASLQDMDGAFSRSRFRGGVPMEDAKAVADAIRSRTPKAPQIILHESVAKAPKALRDAIKAAGADSDVEAAYHERQIHVFPANIASVERLAFVVAHHEIRHHGLRTLLGTRLGPTMLDLWSNPSVKAAAQAKMDAGMADSRVLAVEEALADMPVEDMLKLKGMGKVIAAIRQWLRDAAARLRNRGYLKLADMLEPSTWTDADVAALVQRAEDVSLQGGDGFRTEGTVFSESGAKDQTDTPAFKRWFGDSRVVDAEGKPLVVYHGTGEDFSVFKSGVERGGDPLYAQTGLYFAEDSGISDIYSDREGGNVMPVYLNIRNPLDLTDESTISGWKGAIAKAIAPRMAAKVMREEALRNGLSQSLIMQAERDKLMAAGYDGVKGAGGVWIAFRPEQIKSAIGNSGAFDPANADIRFSRASQDARPQAVQAVQTMPRSPLTGRPVFDLLDADGARIETQHHAKTADEALENYRERPARQAAARAAAPAPTYAMPEKAAKAQGSNWRRVRGQEFTSLDEDDGYLYHVTSLPAANGVRENGLVPNAGGMFGGFYANYSAGKVFLTERGGVSYWQEKVGQQLEAAMDNPPAVTVLRIPKDKIKASLQPDTIGSDDAGAPAFYSSQTVFSRATTAQPARAQQIRFTKKAVRDTIADYLGSAGAKVSWWDKTLGTQYAKAEKLPAFKRVFDQVQNYIEDTSSLANEAAGMASGILPKLETWRDLKNFGMSEADAKAVAAPVFEGTLTDEKVYTAAELKGRFGLTDGQVEQYRQFRAAVSTSLDQVVAADVLRRLGDKNPALAELAVTDRAALRDGVEQYLTDQIGATLDEDARAELEQLREDIRSRYARVDELKAKGYAPLMRFGRYAVNVEDKTTGESLFFGLYESRAAANRMARQLAEDPEFSKNGISQGVLSEQQYKLFQAVPMESLEMFAEAIGAENTPVFQAYLKLAKNNRSALKRLIKRKGTAGFSQDVPRVLAGFITSNARLAAGSLNLGRAKDAIMDIRDGDVKDEAIKLVDQVQNPTDRAGAVRGLMFTNFIGGSIASAAVNLTQPLTMTLPYLSQWGGAAKASARLLASAKQAATGKVDDQRLALALKRAERDGIVSPQEIHHLQAQAMGTWGTNPYLQRLAFIWSAPFSLAEQFNRRVSFIAAYKTAQAEGMADPFAFAEKAVVETQGLYNTGNAPNLSRSAIGASVMTFKQFSIHYLEWMGRMWKSGPEGKKAVGIALALLVLAAGTDGLPFADDLDDLVDTLAQALGYDLNSKATRRRFVAETLGLGDEVADVAARGFSAAAGIPLDVSLRMSMGNLIPASGMLLRSNTDRSSDLLEVAGPAGGLARQYMDAGQAALRGDAGGAVRAALPVALQNLAKGVEMWVNGEARDTKGRKVMDADELDALVKSIGFNPSSIARESQKMGMIRRSEQLAKNVEGEIAAAWAMGLADRDREAVAAARERLATWNENNPDSRIVITQAQIQQRVKKLRQTRAQRFITSTSPERRRATAEALE